MARLRYLSRDDLPEDYRHLWDKNMGPSGRMSNLFRMLAHSPRMMHQFLRFGHDVRKRTKLSDRLRELAICTTCLHTGDTFEFYLHFTNGAREAGITDELIAGLALFETYPGFTDQIGKIRYATEVTKSVRASDETFAGIRAFLSEEEIVGFDALDRLR
ncbi:MAG: carboxymuconolactone decarboxylase family protein [Dehalococcoidia bacterium]